MENCDIKWFSGLIEGDRQNKKSKKRTEELAELFLRFVDNCPSARGPKESDKFVDYGLRTKRSFGLFKKRLFTTLAISQDNYICLGSSNDLYETRDDIIRLYRNRKRPTILFVKGEYGEIDSLFIRIRNAFAHGNYFKKGDYYILWNGADDGKPLKCFMMLKYSHLISIFDSLKAKN